MFRTELKDAALKFQGVANKALVEMGKEANAALARCEAVMGNHKHYGKPAERKVYRVLYGKWGRGFLAAASVANITFAIAFTLGQQPMAAVAHMLMAGLLALMVWPRRVWGDDGDGGGGRSGGRGGNGGDDGGFGK